MPKLEVGQRVAVYHAPTWSGRHGTVQSIYGTGQVEVRPDGPLGSPSVAVWPQQLRRLIKRKRRSVWLIEIDATPKSPAGFSHYVYTNREDAENEVQKYGGHVFEFREVRQERKP